MPRAWSTLRSLSAATLPMYSPGLMQDGSSLVIGCTDSSSLVERWDALLSLPSSAHPLANSPPAKKGHAYSELRLLTLQHQHLTLIGGGPGLILEVDATGGGELRANARMVALSVPTSAHHSVERSPTPPWRPLPACPRGPASSAPPLARSVFKTHPDRRPRGSPRESPLSTVSA